MSIENEVISITITQDTAVAPFAGFGIPLVLSHNWPYNDFVRFYGSIDDVSPDWGTTTPEYRAAQALFGQSIKPVRIAIGGSKMDAGKPTLQYTIGQQALRNSDSISYKINVVGQGFTDAVASYTSDASATAEEIHNGLVTALNAVTGKNFTATFAALVYADKTFTADNTTETFTIATHGLVTGDGPFQVSNAGGALPAGLTALTDYWVIVVDANTIMLATTLVNALAGTNVAISDDGTGTQTISDTASTKRPSDDFTVTGDAAGNWFSLELVDVTALTMSITHSGDPTALLELLELNQPNWYCLLTNYNSKAYVQNAAAWVEANVPGKIYVFDCPETESIQTAASGATDTLGTLHTAAYTRTAGSYHHRPATMMSAAWAGRVLPIDPGGDTWALKQLTGTSMSSTLTATNRVNLEDRNANFVVSSFGGKNVTYFGTTFDGDYIDITRGNDWVKSDMAAGIGTTLLNNDKVPFIDAGVSLIVNDIEATLDRAVQRQIYAVTPKPKVTAPKVADVSTADKAARTLPDIKFSATNAGAIHKVKVKGLVSL